MAMDHQRETSNPQPQPKSQIPYPRNHLVNPNTLQHSPTLTTKNPNKPVYTLTIETCILTVNPQTPLELYRTFW